jgi:hypothetical protein
MKLINFVISPPDSILTVVDINNFVLTHIQMCRQYLTSSVVPLTIYCRHGVNCVLLQKSAAQGT